MMTTTESTHHSDNTEDFNTSSEDVTGHAKTNLQKLTRKRTVVLKPLLPLFGGFCLFAFLYIYVASEIDRSSALLVACALTLFIMVGWRHLSKQQPPHEATHLTQGGKAVRQSPGEMTKELNSDQDSPQPDPFDVLVQEAVQSIPEEFQEHMDNLAILIEDEPDAETLERVGVGEGRILLGLYQGVPLTAYGHSLLPERITIYQHNIERYCHGDPERIRAQVKKTVLHEVAHHFGMGHEEMPIWVR
jgi:predicted Zn-dependent protease with MMP-like domain